eukprot:418682-Rhodomonas_salina.1
MDEGYACWPGSYANRYCLKCACTSTTKKEKKGKLTDLLNLNSSDIKQIKNPDDTIFNAFFNLHKDNTITLKLNRPPSSGLIRGEQYPGYGRKFEQNVQQLTKRYYDLHPNQHQTGPGMGQEHKPDKINSNKGTIPIGEVSKMVQPKAGYHAWEEKGPNGFGYLLETRPKDRPPDRI